jgi:translocation and assembly module TamB
VLAQLLFHQSASSLSPFQLAEIAAALAQISGVGSGIDPLNSLRSGLGLDRLSVGGGSGNGSSATVQAGRYIAKGVYVGANQSTSGSGTQATVQVDLYKGLKLEADVGTGGTTSATGAASSTTANGQSPNGTSIGLTYQFNY